MKRIPSQLVFLGDAIELDGSTWEWTWLVKDKTKLYSNDAGTMLVIMTDKKLGKSLTSKKAKNRDSRKAEKLYSRFMEFEHDYKHLYAIKREPVLKRMGHAQSIIYRSNKWKGTQTRYLHDFSTPPQIWTDNPSKPAVIILCAAKIRVTADGIKG